MQKEHHSGWAINRAEDESLYAADLVPNGSLFIREYEALPNAANFESSQPFAPEEFQIFRWSNAESGALPKVSALLIFGLKQEKLLG